MSLVGRSGDRRRVLTLIRREHTLGSPNLPHGTMFEPHDTLADLGDLIPIVTNEKDGAPRRVKPLDLGQASGLKLSVDNR